jgi:CRP/FNR family transcriptional regulator, transcriptional activator FtrB
LNVSAPLAELHAAPVTARQALDAIPWLSEVAAPTLDRLAAQAMLHRLPTGALAFEQADVPAFAMFLISGRLKLVGVSGQTEATIETVRPGELVLPAAVVTGQPYLLRARVLEEAQLLLVGAERFREELKRDNALSGATLALVSMHLRRQLRAAKSLRMRSAEERVAAYLRALVAVRDGPDEITLAADKSEIAADLGMTRETFSRTLSNLAAHGVSVAGRRLRIEDVGRLRARFPSDPFIDGDDPLVLPALREAP